MSGLTFWHGVAALPALAILIVALLCAYDFAQWAWRLFARGPGFALRLLWRPRQRRAVKNWERQTHTADGIWRTLAYDLRGTIYSFERILNDPEYQYHHKLFAGFLRRGWYPIFTEAIPRLAAHCRDLEAQIQASDAERQARWETEAAEREAANAARAQAVENLLGPGYQNVHWQKGCNEYIPGIDRVVELPESDDYEPVPGKPYLRIKYPRMVVTVDTVRPYPEMNAYCPADVPRPHQLSLNLTGRIRAVHPELFKKK